MISENMIAVCGPVDAGKSSLIGVLTTGELDDGRGCARNKILIHPHEIQSGRTSNITLNPIIYKNIDNTIYLSSVLNPNKKKNIVNKKLFTSTDNLSKKIISFIDLAGHEKYMRTTVFGVTGMFPDYGILVIGANAGISRLTREHLGILLYLKIPIIIIITKIDMAPKQIYKKLINRLKKIIEKTSFEKILYYITYSEKNNKETEHYINHMNGDLDIIPVISISNKTGININNLHKILYNLPNQKKWNEINKGTVVYIDSNYQVPGIGLVLSGTVKGQPIKIKQKMFLGPFQGEFKKVIIRSIHNSIRENITEIKEKVQGCFNIKFLNPKNAISRNQLHKGIVLIDDINKWSKNICKKFIAKVNILHHSTTIQDGYSPLIHCGPIRQCATIKILNQNNECIRTGDSCLIEFTFKNHVEFIEKNMIIFFRDGSTKGVGEVLDINV